MNKAFSLKEATLTLEHKAHPDGLYIEDILATFGNRSLAACVLFFSLPFIQPIPLLGLSTPVGFILMTFGFLIMFKKPFWLPKKILRKHLPAKIVISCCKFLIKVLNKTEKLIKPRLPTWTSRRFTQILNGSLIVIFAFFLSLPLPIPFSNVIPGWFLLTNAIGELEEDGLVMWISYGIALLGFCFFIGLGVGLQEVLKMTFERF